MAFNLLLKLAYFWILGYNIAQEKSKFDKIKTGGGFKIVLSCKQSYIRCWDT